MKSLFSLTLFLFILPLSQLPAIAKERIEDEVKNFLKKNNGAGLAIAVYKDQILKTTHKSLSSPPKPYEKTFCFGYAKRSQRIPVSESTLFRLRGLSSFLTSLLLLDTIEEGKMLFEDDAAKFSSKSFTFPMFHQHKIKILDLALHTSGLPFLPTIPMKHYQASEVEIKNYFKNFKLSRQPGARYEPSELGMASLAYLLSAFHKASYETLLREKIFKPLGMQEAFYSLPLAKMSRVATGYRALQEVGLDFIDRDGSFFKPARGVILAITDMQKLLGFLLQKEDAELFSLRKPLPFSDFHHVSLFGKVTPLSSSNPYPMHFRKDTSQGYSHFLGVVPLLKAGVVILSNSEYDVEALGRVVLDLLCD